jgi:hypothetical protein
MKMAASLALFLACALGAWAINDYHNNEQMNRDFLRQGATTLTFRLNSGKDLQFDTIEMCRYYERRDAIIGILSIVCILASIALFRHRPKRRWG